MEDDLEFKRETLVIEGDRKLFSYTFVLDGEALPPMPLDDESAQPPR